MGSWVVFFSCGKSVRNLFFQEWDEPNCSHFPNRIVFGRFARHSLFSFCAFRRSSDDHLEPPVSGQQYFAQVPASQKNIKDPISCDMAMTVVKVRARARNLFLLHIQTIQPNLFNPFEWWTHGIDGIHSSELFGNWRWGEVQPSKFRIGNPRGVVMWTFLDSLHLCCTRHFVWTDGGQAWKHIFPKKFSTKTMDSLRILKLISMIPSGITYEVLFGEITTTDEPRSWEAETHGAWENRT